MTSFFAASTLNKVAVFLVVAAVAFAGGVFLGREYPSYSGVKRKLDYERIIEDAMKRTLSPTPTATP